MEIEQVKSGKTENTCEGACMGGGWRRISTVGRGRGLRQGWWRLRLRRRCILWKDERKIGVLLLRALLPLLIFISLSTLHQQG
jgi:hypothetical protein